MTYSKPLCRAYRCPTCASAPGYGCMDKAPGGMRVPCPTHATRLLTLKNSLWDSVALCEMRMDGYHLLDLERGTRFIARLDLNYRDSVVYLSHEDGRILEEGSMRVPLDHILVLRLIGHGPYVVDSDFF